MQVGIRTNTLHNNRLTLPYNSVSIHTEFNYLFPICKILFLIINRTEFQNASVVRLKNEASCT